MDVNTIYAYASTSAQTMASAFGVLAAVALVGFSSLESSRSNIDGSWARLGFTNLESMEWLNRINEGDFENFLDFINQRRPPLAPANVQTAMLIGCHVHDLWVARRKLKRGLGRSFGYTCGVVGFSLGGIGAAPVLDSHPHASVMFGVVLSVLLVMSVWEYIQLAKFSLQPEKDLSSQVILRRWLERQGPRPTAVGSRPPSAPAQSASQSPPAPPAD